MNKIVLAIPLIIAINIAYLSVTTDFGVSAVETVKNLFKLIRD